MREINNMLLTSILLLIIFFISINNNFVLIFSLIIAHYLIVCETYNILKKLIKSKKILFFFTIIGIIYFSQLIINIGYITLSNDIDSKILLSFIIAVCVLSDIGGYVFGKLFKGKKITKISPNKTYSGMIGAYILSIVLSLIIFRNFILFDKIIFMSIMISTLSQIGDLIISYLKRKAKIKDTGNILPGHGGLLDRIDGLIFAIPLSLLFMKYI